MSEKSEKGRDGRHPFDDKIELRCYASERNAGLANARQAGFRTLSAFIRFQCLFDPATGQSDEKPRKRPRQSIPPQALEQISSLTRELNAIGNNLNQLATLAHTDRIPRPQIYEARLDEAIHELQISLATLMKYTGNT